MSLNHMTVKVITTSLLSSINWHLPSLLNASHAFMSSTNTLLSESLACSFAAIWARFAIVNYQEYPQEWTLWMSTSAVVSVCNCGPHVALSLFFSSLLCVFIAIALLIPTRRRSTSWPTYLSKYLQVWTYSKTKVVLTLPIIYHHISNIPIPT